MRKEKENFVFYRDDSNYKYIVFEGTQTECKTFCEESDWTYETEDGEEFELELGNLV